MKLIKRSPKTSYVSKKGISKCGQRKAYCTVHVLSSEGSAVLRCFSSLVEMRLEASKKIDNRKTLLEKLEQDLGIKSSEQWYQLNFTKLKDNADAMKLLTRYHNSVPAMLSELRPDVNWKPWMFLHVPQDFWNNLQNINSYMKWISDELKITQLSDWYKYNASHISERCGKGLLNKFNGSLYHLLSSVYPSYDWKPWLFVSVPKHLWESLRNKKNFATYLEQQLQLQTLEDWHRVTPSDISNHGGSTLLVQYQGSIVKYLQEVYPERQWNDWEFKYKQRLRNFWNEETARRYFYWLASKTGITNQEDWHKITEDDIIKNGGKSLLIKFHGSLFNLLSWAFPEVPWKQHKFMTDKRHSWQDPQEVFKFMEGVKSELGVQEMTDWYKVTLRDLRAVGGRGILARYGESMYNILKTIYPNYDWKPWMFRAVPRSFWSTEASVKDYMKWLETQLGISAMEDWYNISSKEIANFYSGGTILAKYGGLGGLLQYVYPEYPWKSDLFEQGNQVKPSKAQMRLFAAVQKIFPDHKVQMDVKHPQLPQQYELDVFIPDLKLALEYQGEHHYFDHYMYGSVSTFQRRDRQKLRLAKLKGITIVYVPYWWDRTELSLRATIAEARPDLGVLDPIVHKGAVPIPQTPPVATKTHSEAKVNNSISTQ